MPPEPDFLTRSEFARILGVPEDAPSPALRAAALRLLAALEKRRAQFEREHPDGEAGASVSDLSREERLRSLAREVAGLEEALERWGPGTVAGATTPNPASTAVRAASQTDRMSLAGAMLGVAITLLFLIAYAMGYRIERSDGGGFAAAFHEPAKLILMGRMPGATLRIMDADREELFVKTEAEGAVVELREGRYAIEVSREDCPDGWTRSLYFESGATHRFEPFLCVGEGRLTLVTNVPGDRLQIDGFDVEAVQSTPYTLGVGDHTLRLEKKGYVPYEARVRMAPDEDLELQVELMAPGSSGAKPKPPPRVEPPKFEQSVGVRPEPFDLGDLKQAVTPREIRGQASGLLRRAGLGDLPNGGSTAWHDRVSREFLTRFDSDGSGLIDRVEESDAVPCVLWKEVELDFARGGLGLSMARYYGFDGSEWHPKALGFARGTRSAAYVKMMECGLAK